MTKSQKMKMSLMKQNRFIALHLPFHLSPRSLPLSSFFCIMTLVTFIVHISEDLQILSGHLPLRTNNQIKQFVDLRNTELYYGTN